MIGRAVALLAASHAGQRRQWRGGIQSNTKHISRNTGSADRRFIERTRKYIAKNILRFALHPREEFANGVSRTPRRLRLHHLGTARAILRSTESILPHVERGSRMPLWVISQMICRLCCYPSKAESAHIAEATFRSWDFTWIIAHPSRPAGSTKTIIFSFYARHVIAESTQKPPWNFY